MAPVLSVTSDQLNLWLASFFLPFVRILSLVASAPIFGEASVPRRVKVALALLLTVLITPALTPIPAFPLMSATGLWVLVQQVLIGLAMGFAMRMVFAAVQATGEYVGLQMGLSFASFFDATSGGNTQVLARLLNVMAILIFLATDSHLTLIRILAQSFQSLPVTDAPLARGGWLLLVLAGANVFADGLMLALPLIAGLLSVNLAMGILNRISPQFSIFSVGFPITILVGIGLLQLLMQYLAPALEPRIGAGLNLMQQFLR